jgi:hypothetical protein
VPAPEGAGCSLRGRAGDQADQCLVPQGHRQRRQADSNVGELLVGRIAGQEADHQSNHDDDQNDVEVDGLLTVCGLCCHVMDTSLVGRRHGPYHIVKL